MKTIGALVLVVASIATAASGRWKPEYAQLPEDVRDWYRSAELTAPAQERFGFKSCCDSSDVVKSQFRVDRTTGADQWFYLKDGVFLPIPPDIIHWGEHAPDNQPTLFALAHQIGSHQAGELTCFYPPDGGI